MEQEAKEAVIDFDRVIMDCRKQYEQSLESMFNLEKIGFQIEREIVKIESNAALGNHDMAETERRREILLTKAAELAVEVTDTSVSLCNVCNTFRGQEQTVLYLELLNQLYLTQSIQLQFLTGSKGNLFYSSAGKDM